MRGTQYGFRLLAIHEPLGVIGLKATEIFDENSEQGLLLSACARELVTALERTQLSGAVHRSQIEAETERMRNPLLSAVSHDLKTPLSNIVAAATTLLAHRGELEASSFDELLSSIVGEGERLSRLVQNLLSITRLESPTIELKRTPEAVDEMVAALDRLRPQIGTREIKVDLPRDLPWILAEPALIQQVLANVLENALRYTPPTSAIKIWHMWPMAASTSRSPIEALVSQSRSGIACSKSSTAARRRPEMTAALG